MTEEKFCEESYWADKWVNHIENYLSGPPRCGLWLESRLNLKDETVVECAGGSCRDSRYLHERGISSIGTDFDRKTLEYLEERFSASPFEVRQEDAFAFSLENKSVDVVFHNGFWVCFDNNDSINKLIIEQERITRKVMVALVHNAQNVGLVKRFSENSREDDLYKIRFFHREELLKCILDSKINYKSLSINKFGGPVDWLFDLECKLPFLGRVIRWVVPRVYRFQPWSKVERIALVVELE